MGALEIVLLIAGGAIFAISFILPKKKEELDESTKQMAGEQIRDILDKEIKGVQSKIEDVVSETIEESSSETKRTLEKMTNEKIMAINEYSDTVIDDISKNHKEVLFLYDMLNDKHVTIRNTVTEVEKTVTEVTQTAKDIEISTRENAKEIKSSAETVKRAVDITNRAEKAAELTAQNIELDVRRIVEDTIRGKVEDTLEKTAVPMIQERVDEILSDASVYMDQNQPKISVGSQETAKEENAKTEEKQTAEVTKQTTRSKKKTTKKETAAMQEQKEKSSGESKTENASDNDFVEGIALTAPKIILENTEEENPQFYVVEAADLEVRPTQIRNMPVAETVEPVVQSKPETTQKRNSNDRILSLHKEGMSVVAIAKELSLGVGEVRLVIDLFEGTKR